MLPRHLLSLVVGFLLQAGVRAEGEQSFLAGGLPQGLGKKEQVKNVLEHESAKHPSCEQFVSSILVVDSYV